jgi:hypothetical protein
MGFFIFFVATLVSLYAYIRAWRKRGRLPGSWLVEDMAAFSGKLPDEPVTVGRFRNFLDAEANHVRLEASGIDSTVFGEQVVRSMPYLQIAPPMLFPVELRVRARDAERALEALRTTEPEPEGEWWSNDDSNPSV